MRVGAHRVKKNLNDHGNMKINTRVYPNDFTAN